MIINKFSLVFALLLSTLMITACSDKNDQGVSQQSEQRVDSAIEQAAEAVVESGDGVADVVAELNEAVQTVQEKSEMLAEEASSVVAEAETRVIEQVEKTEAVVTASVEKVAESVAETAAPGIDEAKMLELAKKSGCLGCHAVDRKVIGPAWRDVGAKYRQVKDGREQMITSVTNGSTGKWGEAQMPPYSPRVSDANIASLVDFVLSLE